MEQKRVNPDCEAAIAKLNAALRSLKEAAGANYTFILVPHFPNEEIVISRNGEIVPPEHGVSPEEILSSAISARE